MSHLHFTLLPPSRMPHLQEKVTTDPSRPESTKYRASPSEAPITEAKEGFLQATEGLLTIKGMVSAHHQRSSSLGPPRAVSEDASSTPRTTYAATKQSVITPSPFAGSHHQHHHHRHMYGPIVTVFGNKKLVPSPIRVKRRTSSQAEEDCEDGAPEMGRPTNLRYADNYSTPTREVGSSEVVPGDSESLKKRLLGKMELELHTESAAKKARVQDCESEDDVATQDDESKETSGSRKPVISPTNSEEGPPSVQRTGFFPPYGAYPQQPYHPQHHGTYHHYAAAYHMYHGFPPPHAAHFGGRTGAASMPQYPPYPPHHYPMMMMHPDASSPHRFSAPQQQTMHGMPGPDITRSSSLPNDEIHSVPDWRRSAMSDGRPVSANKCLPLKEPIPSKYWG